MSDARLIAPPLRSASVETGAPPRPPRPVPTDLLREASRRLGVVCLLSAGLWILATGLDRAVGYSSRAPGDAPDLLQPSDGIAVASIALSLALYAFTRRKGRDPRVSLDLGLAYLVATGLALGLTIHWDPPPPGLTVFPIISWTGVATLMFAAIIPASTVRTLVAGLIAVSMNPLGMLLARARGTWDFAAAGDALVMHYPDYLLVGVSLVISSVVRRLGQQVAQAREMGSYQLGELLGRGGMGEVYRATHRMLARPAAIKLIRPEMLGAPDSEAAQLAVHRFRREAEAAASLRSPHTVELYDFGVTEDRTMYFVMELLEGMTLETLVREKGPLPPGRVIHVLRQVCASLEEAHARGLVHRDIKPANIHLGRLGLTCDFVKVLDFGLVKSMSATAGEDSLGTAAGLTPGTPAYMAPEMALGEAVDGRADLYALGCVAYYLLTGVMVFEAAGGLQLVARHLHDLPVPPSERTELPVPPALERLVLACLAKRPADRPANARALAHALATVEAPPWGEAQAAQWWRDHRPA
ncbi:MAG: serine/threonine protein kinase [Gemmatimonadetes bacterium]|nr:serine/threonine protein kinase [Gemmatimonadota bacterium]